MRKAEREGSETWRCCHFLRNCIIWHCRSAEVWLQRRARNSQRTRAKLCLKQNTRIKNPWKYIYKYMTWWNKIVEACRNSRNSASKEFETATTRQHRNMTSYSKSCRSTSRFLIRYLPESILLSEQHNFTFDTMKINIPNSSISFGKPQLRNRNNDY